MNSLLLTDHQLADKGWNKMRSMLDKEMPKPRKRRPIPWWWAAAVLTGLILLYENQHSFHVEKPAVVISGAQKTVTSIDHQEIINVSAVRDHNRLPVKNNSQSSTDRDKNLSSSTAKGHTQNTIPSQSSLRANRDSALSGTLVMQPDDMPESVEEIPSQPHGFAEVIHQEALPQLPAVSKIPYPSEKPELSSPLPDLQRVSESAGLKKLVKRNHASRVDFGLMVGANALQVKQVPGFMGGMTFNFFLPRRKFGLQTGLLYRYQVFSGESRPVIPVSYDRYVHATANYDIQPKGFPNNSLIYFSTNNSVLIPVMKSHQIEMPALFFWQPHFRWRIYGGMTVLRHVWVQSANKALFTYDLQVVTTTDDKAAGNINTAITEQLPAWEKNWQTGFSFKPLRRLEVGLFYRSAWKGKPLLADAANLFNTCKSCSDNYPEAEKRTTGSLRPRSLQLNATIKF